MGQKSHQTSRGVNSSKTWRYVNGSDPFSAMIMISREEGNWLLERLKNSLKRRLILFRRTAPPVFFPTVKPKRVRPRWLGFMITKKWGKTIFRSVLDLRRKSLRFNTLTSLGKGNGFIELIRRKNSRSSDRQPFSSLGPPSFNHLTSPGGAHSD